MSKLRPKTFVTAGTLLLVTHQEHDDYRPLCIARAVRDLDVPALRAAFTAVVSREQRERGGLRGTAFLRWLLEQGILQEQPCRELWIDASWHDEEFPAQDEVKPWPPCADQWWWEL